MRSMIALVITFITLPTHADEVYRSSNPQLQNMVKVIEKDSRCALAVVEQARPNAPEVIRSAGSSQIHSFICIGDIDIDSGTLKEKKGCGAFILNGNDLTTQPFVSRFGYNIAENKKCDAGGFETVIKDEVWNHMLVSDKLVDTTAFPTEKILLYSTNKKYLDWYRKARTDREARNVVDLAKKKGDYPRFFNGYQDRKGTLYKELVSGEPLLKSGK